MAATGHALVTGASSGIGAAIARALATRGVPLILTARRVDRLEALATELRDRVDVHLVPADLADAAAVAGLVDAIEHRGLQVRMLVNNAGYGVPGRFDAVEWGRHADFLQVMVTRCASSPGGCCRRCVRFRMAASSMSPRSPA